MHESKEKAVGKLISRGVRVKGKFLDIKTNSLGIKSWGIVDYLAKVHGFSYRIIDG